MQLPAQLKLGRINQVYRIVRIQTKNGHVARKQREGRRMEGILGKVRQTGESDY